MLIACQWRLTSKNLENKHARSQTFVHSGHVSFKSFVAWETLRESKSLKERAPEHSKQGFAALSMTCAPDGPVFSALGDLSQRQRQLAEPQQLSIADDTGNNTSAPQEAAASGGDGVQENEGEEGRAAQVPVPKRETLEFQAAPAKHVDLDKIAAFVRSPIQLFHQLCVAGDRARGVKARWCSKEYWSDVKTRWAALSAAEQQEMVIDHFERLTDKRKSKLKHREASKSSKKSASARDVVPKSESDAQPPLTIQDGAGQQLAVVDGNSDLPLTVAEFREYLETAPKGIRAKADLFKDYAKDIAGDRHVIPAKLALQKVCHPELCDCWAARTRSSSRASQVKLIRAAQQTFGKYITRKGGPKKATQDMHMLAWEIYEGGKQIEVQLTMLSISLGGIHSGSVFYPVRMVEPVALPITCSQYRGKVTEYQDDLKLSDRSDRDPWCVTAPPLLQWDVETLLRRLSTKDTTKIIIRELTWEMVSWKQDRVLGVVRHKIDKEMVALPTAVSQPSQAQPGPSGSGANPPKRKWENIGEDRRSGTSETKGGANHHQPSGSHVLELEGKPENEKEADEVYVLGEMWDGADSEVAGALQQTCKEAGDLSKQDETVEAEQDPENDAHASAAAAAAEDLNPAGSGSAPAASGQSSSSTTPWKSQLETLEARHGVSIKFEQYNSSYKILLHETMTRPMATIYTVGGTSLSAKCQNPAHKKCYCFLGAAGNWEHIFSELVAWAVAGPNQTEELHKAGAAQIKSTYQKRKPKTKAA